MSRRSGIDVEMLPRLTVDGLKMIRAQAVGYPRKVLDVGRLATDGERLGAGIGLLERFLFIMRVGEIKPGHNG